VEKKYEALALSQNVAVRLLNASHTFYNKQTEQYCIKKTELVITPPP